MGRKMIIFQDPKAIVDFTHIIEKYPYDMDLKRGRYVVDAKEFEDVFHLGTNHIIELKVYENAENLGKLWEELSPYMAA